MNKVLTIAGSDSSGGAGLQADLKTFTALGVYGMSVVTAVTAQNTLGVQAVEDLPVALVEQQLSSVMTDIGADAVKTGMLSGPDMVQGVAEALRQWDVVNLVVDPVMVAQSGDRLLSPSAELVLREQLVPLAMVLTPNIHEAQILLDRSIQNLEDMKSAARDMVKLGCHWAVIKSGHLLGESMAVDVASDGQEVHLLRFPYVPTRNTHGTGCTLSAAIAAGLAQGRSPLNAMQLAKSYVTKALQASCSIGHGHGPVNHCVNVV